MGMVHLPVAIIGPLWPELFSGTPRTRQRKVSGCDEQDLQTDPDMAGLAVAGCAGRDAVAYLGSSYLAVKSSTGKVPSGSPGDWALLAARGAPGARGRQGSVPVPDLAGVATLDWWGGPHAFRTISVRNVLLP